MKMKEVGMQEIAYNESALRQADAERKPVRRRRKYDKSQVLSAVVCLLPSFALLVIFTIVPLILSFYYSFFDVKEYLGNTFIWFRNYATVLSGLQSAAFYKSLLVGLEFIAIIVPLQLILSFLIANLVMKINRKYAAIIKVCIYLPCLLSGIVVGSIFAYVYNYHGGLLNSILNAFGLSSIDWTGEKGWAMFAVCIAAIWNGLGYNTLVMLGGLYDIPTDYYEAARLDGANWWKQTVYITIPSLKNIGLYLLVSLVVSSFQLYEIPLVIVGNGAEHSLEGPIYYLFYRFQYTDNMGEVYAASLLVAVVLTALSSVIFKLTSSEKSQD